MKWLFDKLNKLIDNAKKQGSRLINEEKLWSTYHKLHISTLFEQTWENFLDKQPLLYQHITDKAIELLIQKNVPSESSIVRKQSKEQQKLTMKRRMLLRYVGGYVI